jgi:transcriptional regulator with XRE-family HTH domain
MNSGQHFTQSQGFRDSAARNHLPGRRNTLPDMKKRTAGEVLADNLKRIMATDQEFDSDRKLAKASGVSHKTINNILNGRHDVQISNVEKIAKALQIDTYQLMCPHIDAAFLL